MALWTRRVAENPPLRVSYMEWSTLRLSIWVSILQTRIKSTATFTLALGFVCQFSSTITSLALPSGELRIILPLPLLVLFSCKSMVTARFALIALVAWKYVFDSALRNPSVHPNYGWNGTAKALPLMALVAFFGTAHLTFQPENPRSNKRRFLNSIFRSGVFRGSSGSARA